jgi:hypothetical protein
MPEEETAALGPRRLGDYGSALRSTSQVLFGDGPTEFLEEGASESVYSLALFVSPILCQKTGTRHGKAAYFTKALVLLNFLMQFALLVLVQGFVIHEAHHSFDSVIHREPSAWRPWDKLNNFILGYYTVHFTEGASEVHGKAGPLFINESPVADCHTDSLCSSEDSGRISCGPASLQLLSDWRFLDVDGDGFWTLAEASDADYRELMKCKFGTDVMVLFNRFIEDMKTDTLLGKIALIPNITKGLAIPKHYFDAFLYIPMLCMYADQDMCANMFTRGVFHQAIKKGTLNLANASHFCRTLLSGGCDEMLPGTYRKWRLAREETCGKRRYTPAEYASPDGSPDNLMMRVDFENRLTYGNAMAWHFIAFRSVIMLCFLGSMLNELRDMIRNLQALHPGVEIIFDTDCASDVPKKDRTATIDSTHRVSMFVVALLRALLWVMLLHTGVLFLDRSNSYLDLIFDAVSLVFIFEIDEMLYGIFVRDKLRSMHSNSHILLPVQHEGIVLELCGIIVLAVGLSTWHAVDVTGPLKEALDCVCLWEGGSCIEATTYSPAWWDRYWTQILPQSQEAIKRLTKAA